MDIARYLKFVIAFLIIMFSVLGLYEFYYGAEARRTQELQQEFNRLNMPGASAATTTAP